MHYGRTEIVDKLLKNSADPNKGEVSPPSGRETNHGGNTPLHIAVQYGYKKIQDQLIEAGANENETNNDGMLPWEGMTKPLPEKRGSKRRRKDQQSQEEKKEEEA